MTNAFDERLDQVDRALKIIASIESNPDLQVAAFNLLFGTPAAAPTSPAAPAPAEGGAAAAKPRNGGTKRASKATSVSQDKSLDIAPKGKQPWVDFAALKKPGNLSEKYATGVYWLLEVAELPAATLNQVYTLFLTAKWAVPANPRNKLHMAGSDGYLDTADANNIKLTSGGTAHILNVLPHDKK